MANLYDKAGLVNIPVGYQDGFLYNIKPEDNTLGFRFNRDSAATLVNSKGLIEQVGYFGPELVQNGDFSQQGSELMPSVGVIENNAGGTITQISGNSYSSTSDGTSSSTLRPKFDFNTTSGKTYKLVITPIGTITGTVNFDFYDGTTYLFQNYDFTTTKEIYFTDNGSVFGAFDGTQTYSITNFTISVKQVDPNDYWILGTGWSFGDSKAIFNGGADAAIQQLNVVENGKTYKFKIDVNDRTSGNLQIRFGNAGSVDATIGSNGSYVYNFTSDGTTLYLRAISGFNGSITNISVVEVKGDKPRIDYTDSLTSPSFLLEPQSTNLVAYSEQFDNSYWTKARSSITSNQITAPDGTNSADKFFDSTDNNTHLVYRSLSVSTSDEYTFSCFLKKGSLNKGFLAFDSSVNASVVFDLENGTIESEGSSISTSNIEQYSNNWYKCSFTHTPPATPRLYRIGTYNGGISYAGTGTDFIYIWGAQLEQSLYPTSYIPTTGSTVTRAQETCIGAGNVSTFNSTEGVLYAEMASLADDGTTRYVSVSDGGNQNAIAIRFSDVNNQILAYTRIGGVFNAVLLTSSYSTVNFNKIAYRYKSGDSALFINGTKISSSTSTQTLPSNTLNTLGFNDGLYAPMEGKVKGVYVFNEALTDDELQQLTGPEYNSFAALAAAYNYTVI